MSILLVQVSDIHFKEATDPAAERAFHIGAAIAAEVTADVTTIVLAICGDATHSGAIDQFDTAKQFVGAIDATLRSRCPGTNLTHVVVPGNHDCDFIGDQAARNGLLPLINQSDRPAQSITQIVLTPLTGYFEFAKALAGDANAITDAHPFYHAVDVHDGNSSLRLHLLNTAWMSSLHEQPGTVCFPLAEISPPVERSDCSFAILHHPTHWFSQPHAMRPLRDRLADLSSVVLVNHEHVPEATEQTPLMDRDGGATKTIYVSGGVIQEAEEPLHCSFNILKLDVATKSLRLTRHEYRIDDGTPYFERTAEKEVDISATALSVGPAGASLSPKILTVLDDPGAPISHPHRDPRIPVRLRDIFLYPDLWELDADHAGGDHRQIRSVDVSEKLLTAEKVLITGGEKSGRTAIAKRLFMAAFESGKVPVFLDGGSIPKKSTQLRKKIREAVKDQYSNLSPDKFEQLERSDRVVVIDDMHRMAPATTGRKELLEELEHQFGTVLLCGDDLIKLDELNGKDARDSGLWEYRHFVILEFGEVLREQFVRQWLMLGGDTIPDDVELDGEVDRICGLLDVVIRKQLLPAYPLFLLVVLQQSDLANASVQNGSFGKLLEGVITAILNKSALSELFTSSRGQCREALNQAEDFSRQPPGGGKTR